MDKKLDGKGVAGFIASLFVMPFVLNYFFEADTLSATLIAFTTIVVYHFTADLFLFVSGWMNKMWEWRRDNMRESHWMKFLEYGFIFVVVSLLLHSFFSNPDVQQLAEFSLDGEDWVYTLLVLLILLGGAGCSWWLYTKVGDPYRVKIPDAPKGGRLKKK